MSVEENALLKRLLENNQELARLIAQASIPKPDRWVSVKEAAELVGVTRQTIYRWIDGGQLQAGRCGGTLRVQLSAIDRAFSPPAKRTPTSRASAILADLPGKVLT